MAPVKRLRSLIERERGLHGLMARAAWDVVRDALSEAACEREGRAEEVRPIRQWSWLNPRAVLSLVEAIRGDSQQLAWPCARTAFPPPASTRDAGCRRTPGNNRCCRDHTSCRSALERRSGRTGTSDGTPGLRPPTPKGLDGGRNQGHTGPGLHHTFFSVTIPPETWPCTAGSPLSSALPGFYRRTSALASKRAGTRWGCRGGRGT